MLKTEGVLAAHWSVRERYKEETDLRILLQVCCWTWKKKKKPIMVQKFLGWANKWMKLSSTKMGKNVRGANSTCYIWDVA